jgi:RNA-directed DNA polymerase
VCGLGSREIFRPGFARQLMARIETRVSDRRLRRLIRAFLEAGVMEGGLVSPVDEGTPQRRPVIALAQ